MPRQNRVERRPSARVAVVIDSIEHTLSEPAFIVLMEQALDVMQALTVQRRRHQAAMSSAPPAPVAAPAERSPQTNLGRRRAGLAQLRRAAGDYTGFPVFDLRTQALADGSVRVRATFEDGGRARFIVRVPLDGVTARDIEDFESLY